MIPHPEQFKKLPRWLRVVKDLVPSCALPFIDDIMHDIVEPRELDESLPKKLQHACQALSLWWSRLKMGELAWVRWIREIAEEDGGSSGMIVT